MQVLINFIDNVYLEGVCSFGIFFLNKLLSDFKPFVFSFLYNLFELIYEFLNFF